MASLDEESVRARATMGAPPCSNTAGPMQSVQKATPRLVGLGVSHDQRISGRPQREHSLG